MDKNVVVKRPGTDGKGEEMVDVAIAAGVTAADIIRKLGKNPAEWILSVPGGKTFGQNDIVYAAVEDGGKIVLTPKMEAGFEPASILSLFSARAASGRTTSSRSTIRVTHESIPSLRITHQETLAVKAQPTPIWQEQGWKRTWLGYYRGKYVTTYGSWEGRIEMGPSGVLAVLIRNPPSVIRSHPNYPCFFHVGGDWFSLHWEDRNPRTVDAAIVNVQRILSEAFHLDFSGRQSYGYSAI